MSWNNTGTILGAIAITAGFGMWCGALQQKVSSLEDKIGELPTPVPPTLSDFAKKLDLSDATGEKADLSAKVKIERPCILFIVATAEADGVGGTDKGDSYAYSGVQVAIDDEVIASNQDSHTLGVHSFSYSSSVAAVHVIDKPGDYKIAATRIRVHHLTKPKKLTLQCFAAYSK